MGWPGLQRVVFVLAAAALAVLLFVAIGVPSRSHDARADSTQGTRKVRRGITRVKVAVGNDLPPLAQGGGKPLGRCVVAHRMA